MPNLSECTPREIPEELSPYRLVVPGYYGRDIMFNTDSQCYFWRDTRIDLSNAELFGVEHNLPIYGPSSMRMPEYVTVQAPLPPTPPRTDEYERRLYQVQHRAISDDLLDGIVEVQELSKKPKWPVGTIVKWNYQIDGVKEHIYRTRKDLVDFPFVRITQYDSSLDVRSFIWAGEIEDERVDFSIRSFKKANKEECAEYEFRWAQLRPCTERPAIGTVLEYLGNNSNIKNKKCAVVSESKNNKVFVQWLDTSRNNEVHDFNLFRVASVQTGSFVPDTTKYCQCENCGSLRRKQSYTIAVKDHRYCNNDCAYEKGWVICSSCANWHKKEEINNETYDGLVCAMCFTARYRECQECNRYHQMDYVYPNADGTHSCSVCLENFKRLIHDHGYKPNFQYQKMSWENTRYLGIELEVEVKGSSSNRSKMADMIKVFLSQQPKSMDYVNKEGKVIKGKTLDKLVYLKSDGSLNNGLEIVFHPFTLKSFHKNFPLKPFLTFLTEHGCEVRNNCGLHVHVSKDRLTLLDLQKGKWFFYKCEKFLKQFSDRAHFDYCKFEPYAPHNDPFRQEYGHYSVLNTGSRSSPTLEVRLFNATLDYKKFLANIQFSDVFVDYIQNGAGIGFFRTKSKYEVWQDFIEYAKSQNRYQVFTNWILQNRIV